jgi:hypothetical protein
LRPLLGMSYALVFGLILAAIAAVALLGGLIWWIRRPVPVARLQADEGLPLFSHARAAVWVRDGDDEEQASDEDDATTTLLAARTERTERRAMATGVPWPSWRTGETSRAANASPRPRSFHPHAYQPPGGATSRPAARPAAEAAVVPAPARPAEAAEGTSAPAARAPADLSPAAAEAPLGTSSVRFSVPTDATLQFLPGRLEITNGADRGRDLRFVRMPGAAITEITFGRCAGAPYRHVQLEDATVSRKHARLRLQQQRWHLTNWSSTNPVLHNGVELAVDEEVALSDGDRVDMGEVIFRFRA